ncbi:MAG: ankyrin repeat domain-containing protein [Pseudomonadota bacterium]
MSDYARMVRAILTEDVQNLRTAIGDGNQLNDIDETGRTPLHIAVMHARTAVIGPLVQAGADPTVKSGDHKSATELAEEKGATVQHYLKQAEVERAAAIQADKAKKRQSSSMSITTRAADAMRARRRSAGLIGDMA